MEVFVVVLEEVVCKAGLLVFDTVCCGGCDTGIGFGEGVVAELWATLSFCVVVCRDVSGTAF
jgi:hypothetical protein